MHAHRGEAVPQVPRPREPKSTVAGVIDPSCSVYGGKDLAEIYRDKADEGRGMEGNFLVLQVAVISAHLSKCGVEDATM